MRFLSITALFRLVPARADRGQEETRKSSVGPRSRGPEAMCSRPLHDAPRATGPFDRVSGCPTFGPSTGHRGRVGRRNRAFCFPEHPAYEHGEKL